MTKNEGTKTFVRITNRDIYDEIVETKQHVMKTNGKVKFNRTALYTLGVMILTLAGWLFYHIGG